MQRRRFAIVTLGAGGVLAAAGVAGLWPRSRAADGTSGDTATAVDFPEHHPVSAQEWPTTPLEREPSYWRQYVESDAWDILFQNQTEPRHSSDLNDLYAEGTFICAACHLPLFSAATKYDSETGWPSFWAPYRDHIGTQRDTKLLFPRTEYHCIRCKGHQGHVFEDGPEPTGERWCNNGLALAFVSADTPLPDLRG